MTTADEVLHGNLVRWIEENGGRVHKNLALHTPLTDHSIEGTDYTKRGIFATRGPILKGEELIRLPVTVALDGASLPVSYDDVSEASSPRNASNWLRCISSLMHALHQRETNAKRSDAAVVQAKLEQSNESVDYSHYIASLPKTYDSLLNWTAWEIKSFLAGTALGVNALETYAKDGTAESSSISSTPTSESSQHDDALRLRYLRSVVPYLHFLQTKLGMFYVDPSSNSEHDSNKSNTTLHERDTKRQKIDTRHANLDELYPLFRECCMCISSRAFHMQLHSKRETDGTEYHGPYLLPMIDLLNHSPQSTRKHVTTLRRDTDGSFVMHAERDVAMGEEICHSYDVGSTEAESSFTSAQTLQTFGFVDLQQSRIIDFFESNGKFKADESNPLMTSAVLTKSDVCKACEKLAQSTYASGVRDLMQQTGMLDDGWEYWDLPSSSNKEGPRGVAMNNLPNELLISFDAPLTDELITMCCLSFLPDETLDELVQDDETLLLDSDVLGDFFLGKLVLQAIIDAVKVKLNSYKVRMNYSDLTDDGTNELKQVLSKVYENEKSVCWGENTKTDARTLSKLMKTSLFGVDKFMYGLTVSLEERACLIELRKKACDMIANM